MEATGRWQTNKNRILGVDPGGTTGICKYHIHTKAMHPLQINKGEHHRDLYNLLKHWKPDIVVCERFDYRPRQRNADLSAVEYIGVIKLWCEVESVPLVLQPQIKDSNNTVWNNTKLSALGLYKAGMPHAMDATRQVLHYVTTNGDNYWVQRYGKFKES